MMFTMVSVDSSTQMETTISATGLMGSVVDTVSSLIIRAKCMKVNGSSVNIWVLELIKSI